MQGSYYFKKFTPWSKSSYIKIYILLDLDLGIKVFFDLWEELRKRIEAESRAILVAR